MATLLKQVQGFTRGQAKAGANGLKLVETTIDHMFEHNDWTPLAWLLAKTEGADSTVLRRVVKECVGGVKLKRDANQPSGLRITLGDNAGPSEKMPLLRELTGESVSFRSKQVREVLFEAPEIVFDLDKWALTLARRMNKEHVTQAKLDNALKSALKTIAAKGG
ncbi:MAG: hypothetical protein GQ574_14570 [Crocinitomix sp.]|nr:hypothetical protein [Crocinitomix sp.]